MLYIFYFHSILFLAYFLKLVFLFPLLQSIFAAISFCAVFFSHTICALCVSLLLLPSLLLLLGKGVMEPVCVHISTSYIISFFLGSVSLLFFIISVVGYIKREKSLVFSKLSLFLCLFSCILLPLAGTTSVHSSLKYLAAVTCVEVTKSRDRVRALPARMQVPSNNNMKCGLMYSRQLALVWGIFCWFMLLALPSEFKVPL